MYNISILQHIDFFIFYSLVKFMKQIKFKKQTFDKLFVLKIILVQHEPCISQTQYLLGIYQIYVKTN